MRAATICLLLLLTLAALPPSVSAEPSEQLNLRGRVVLMEDDSYVLRTDMGDLPLRGGDFLLYAGQVVDAVGSLEQDGAFGGVLDVLSLTPTGTEETPLQVNPYN